MTDVSQDAIDIRQSVVEILGRRPRRAVFVSELATSLQRARAVARDDVERALSELEAEWSVIVRDNYCADPHVEGSDLRVVGLVDRDKGDEGQLEAMRHIEAIWQEWLAEYMANHRCS